MEEAQRLGMARLVGGSSTVYLGADVSSVVPLSARGRKSIRLESKRIFQSGSLVVVDASHLPTGCGTWPAFWMCGPQWPTHGEIDIIEGVHTQTGVDTTLHTNAECSMASEDTSKMTGHFNPGANGQPASNCDVNAPNQYTNQGCSIAGPADSMGQPFNARGGGVYATEWTDSAIRMWFFSRDAIPSDLTSNHPNPSGCVRADCCVCRPLCLLHS